jgi:hypothetical protein
LGCTIPATNQFSHSYSDFLGFRSVARRREQILLDFIYQVLKIYFTRTIKLQYNPKLEELKKDNEEHGDLLRLSPEDMLRRWFNHNLKAAGHGRTVDNWSDSVKDGENYAVLLHHLDPSISKEHILAATGEERARLCIEAAGKLGVPQVFDPAEIAKGNPRVNYLFTAAIYNALLKSQLQAPILNEEDREMGEDDREERGNAIYLMIPADVC